MDQKQENKRKVVGTSKKKKVIFSGTVSNAQLKSKNNVDKLAQYLWVNFDRTRLNDNWNDEIPQRQIKWTSHADHIINKVLKK